MKNKFSVFLCIVFMVILFSGCGYKGYSGEYKDLYTVAINSLLWNNGHSYGADRAIDSQIEILEKDKYGRTLYTYQEAYYSGAEIAFSALLISQCSLNGFVYYYEDFNFLIKQQEIYSSEVNCFTGEEITYLKSLNDWDTEINYEKCIRKEINNIKNNIPGDRKLIEEEAIKRFNLIEIKYNLFLDYLTVDNNGSFIVYGSVVKFDAEEIFFAAFVKSDDYFIEFLVPNDIYNYQQEFADFKCENGWKY